jgi:hypothetical protein
VDATLVLADPAASGGYATAVLLSGYRLKTWIAVKDLRHPGSVKSEDKTVSRLILTLRMPIQTIAVPRS